MAMNGTDGELLVGYQPAATFRSWALDFPDPAIGATDFVLTADLAEVNEFWIDHGERFTVRIRVAKSWWRWTNQSITRDGTRILIRIVDRPEDD